jgi:hypothetical protein
MKERVTIAKHYPLTDTQDTDFILYHKSNKESIYIKKVQGSKVQSSEFRVAEDGCSLFSFLKGNFEHGITNHEYQSRRRKRKNAFSSPFF